MTQFSHIIDKQRFSFSSVSTYETCKYAFKLSYLEKAERINNGFSDYGSYIHLLLERYFTGDLNIWDLKDEYEAHYDEKVITPFPPIPKGMPDNYYNSGLMFFDNFSFDRNKYEILHIESSVESNWHGINLIVKPDLVIKDLSSGSVILFDYKTAKLKDNKIKEEYIRQFYLYSYFLWLETGLEVDLIKVWYIRDNVVKDLPINHEKMQEFLEWFEGEINKIRVEEEWKPNLDKSNSYFCSNLCGVRLSCKYKNGELST